MGCIIDLLWAWAVCNHWNCVLQSQLPFRKLWILIMMWLQQHRVLHGLQNLAGTLIQPELSWINGSSVTLMEALFPALCCNVQWSQNFWLLLCSEFQCNTQPPGSNGTFCTVMKIWALVLGPREVMRSPLLEIQTSNGEGLNLYYPSFEQGSGPEISRGSVQPKSFCASMKLLSYLCSSQFLCSCAA